MNAENPTKPLVDWTLGLQVVTSISPDDQMHTDGFDRHYFAVGKSSLLTINAALISRVGFAGGDAPIKSILDLGCGFGRVTRYLRAAFPTADIAVTDFNMDGARWCADTFGCRSVATIERDAYDLVCLGSVFTHLPAKATAELLTVVKASLRKNGIAVATTQGRFPHMTLRACVARNFANPPYQNYFMPPDKVRGIIDDYERDGFGYRDYPNRTDYGVALGTPAWYINKIVDDKTALLLMHEMGVDKHQDALAFMRLSDGLLHAERGIYY